jgi:SAM-dependent methyltransferase
LNKIVETVPEKYSTETLLNNSVMGNTEILSSQNDNSKQYNMEVNHTKKYGLISTSENPIQCEMDANGCCIVEENNTEKAFWDDRWAAGSTGWDLGNVSPEMQKFFDLLPDKNAAILIPGCGNAYEAEYLLNHGFTNVTLIDISRTLVRNLRSKFANNSWIRILEGDFFQLSGTYDVIVEQTFFCAIPPSMRVDYVQKMVKILTEKGILGGLLFNRDFEGGPPFGGSKEEYQKLFHEHGLEVIEMEMAMNSIPARQGTEVFFQARKKAN